MSRQQQDNLQQQEQEEDDMQADLCAAMALAFSEIDVALKSSNNPFFQSKYADLTAVINSIKPALIKHGLFFVQKPHETEAGGITLETILYHSGGGSLSLGKLFVPAVKSDPQGYGSALTYARRYGLVTAFGVPQADDDGNAASRPSQVTVPAPSLSEEAIADHLAAIDAASTTDDLKRAWSSAEAAAKSANDAKSFAIFKGATNRRKGTLQPIQVAA